MTAQRQRAAATAMTMQQAPPDVRAGNADSLFSLAYDRIENLIVHCRIAPGASVTTKDIQQLVDLGRTPVHQAVRRLAAETLIRVRPRDGLQISPIDLQRDRRLLQLRREMDRFVAEQSTERLNANQRNRLIYLGGILKERRLAMDAEEFNGYDRQFDTILLDAAGEPFLDRTFRPLHTIFRRIGYVYLSHIGGEAGLMQTIDCHIDLLDGVVARNKQLATTSSDRLIDFADSMFDRLECGIDPALLNAAAGF